MNEKKVSAVLLSAGKGSRARTLKPLMPWKNGEVFLSKVFRSMKESRVFDEIVVVTGHESRWLQEEIKKIGAHSIFNPFYERGMHSSICEGLKSLTPDWDGALIALVDQPQLESDDYRVIVEAFKNSPCKLTRPKFGDRFGNPNIVHRSYFLEILAETDTDSGCSYLFKRHPEEVFAVEMPSPRCLVDIDTPEKLREIIL